MRLLDAPDGAWADHFDAKFSLEVSDYVSIA
jgi:hypothetical protein